MNKIMMLLIVPAVMVIISGCSKENPAENHRQELLGTLESRQQAVAEGDVEQIFSYWTDDVVIYPVAENPVRGIAEVRKYVRRSRKELGLKPRISPIEIVASKSGDLGYIVGTYEWIDRQGQASKPGRYVSLWRTNEHGEWKCFLEIHSPKPVDDISESDG